MIEDVIEWRQIERFLGKYSVSNTGAVELAVLFPA
jgi:hypothetical protein